MKTVYSVIFLKRTPDEIFTECWGVYDSETKAEDAMLEDYYKLCELYNEKPAGIEKGFALLLIRDHSFIELKVDATAYYAEV